MQMKKLATRQFGIVSMLAAAGLMVAACGGGVNSSESSAAAPAASTAASAAASEAAPAAADCGDWGVAMHAWVGYTASAQVLTNVAESLGCNITQTTLDEAGVTYDAMEAGSVDVIVEDWGGGRWQEWVDRGAIAEVGSNGNVGLIGGGVQVNFVPDRCALQIDRRLLPGERTADVLATYQTILDRMASDDPAVRAELVPPFLVDEALETPADARATTLASEVAGDLGLNGQPVGVPYGSDASKLSRHGFDCIVFGPGSIDQAHGAVEYVDISQVEKAAEFYREFSRRYE